MQRLTAPWLKHCQESAQSLPRGLPRTTQGCEHHEHHPQPAGHQGWVLRGTNAPMEVCRCQPVLLLMHQG